MALYADIVGIGAPLAVQSGDTVTVGVDVKNISSDGLYMILTGVIEYDTTQVPFQTDYGYVGPNGVVPFTIHFNMPASNVRFHVWSWYWNGAKWVQGDYSYIDITLITEEYAGTITDKWLNKAPEGFRISIPAQVTTDNNTFEVGVKYKNLSGKTVTMGPKVQVWDSEGTLRASPATDWTGMSHNEELSTEYNICRADKSGDWLVRIDLLVDPDNPVVVSTWYGLLFAAAPVGAQYKGLIVLCDMYKATEGKIPLPATVIANSEYFKVFVDCKNTSSITYTGGVELKVYDPTGALRASPIIDWTGIAPNQELEWEYNRTNGLACTVDKVGSWVLRVRFLEQTTLTVLDEKTLYMTAVGSAYTGSVVHVSMQKATEGEVEFPATVLANEENFKVFIDCKNTFTVTYTAGVELKVYDPTGALRASPTVDWTGIAPNQELEWEYNKTNGLACTVDKVGSWTLEVKFLEQTTLTVLDEKILYMTAIGYSGSITGKWINKAPEGNNLPFGYDIDLRVAADNNTFEVGVKYKNLSGGTVYAGCSVKVVDPQDVVRATPAVDWAGMGNFEELSTQYNICRVDEAGVWYIHIDLLINKDNPVVVASYDGQLFVAVARAGTITRTYINKGSQTYLDLPTSVTANNQTFEVGVKYRNASTLSYIAGVQVKVYDPDGLLRASPDVDYTGIAPNEELRTEYNICEVDKVGGWTIEFKFLERDTLVVLDEVTKTMTATGAPEPPAEPIEVVSVTPYVVR